MTQNNIIDIDSYKASHFLMQPPGTEATFNYLEARGGHYDYVVFYAAMKYYLEMLATPVTMDNVEEANEIITSHGEPFPYDGWKHVVENLGGHIPLRIRALPEGTIVPTGLPLMTIESTDPQCFWMPGWTETARVRLWYPNTVTTRSHYIKKIIMEYLEKTSDNPQAEINFKLHDFGSRGVSSRESATIGGSAHLVNFMGTDTVTALPFIRKYYGEKMAGFSIPAAEHSTIISWGVDRESEAYKNIVNVFGRQGGLVAVVSDSYNIYRAVEDIWCSTEMQDLIKSKGCTVVIRPDSGNPATVIINLLMILDKKLEMTVNSKGFKVLPSHIRLIQGDGVDESSIQEILATMARAGYSASNIAFGMGGALLQRMDRDTLSYAEKLSAIKINGVWQSVSKNPIGDSSKKSKAGRVDTFLNHNNKYKWRTGLNDEVDYDLPSAMQDVYLNGEIMNMSTWSQIREQATIKTSL